MTHIVIHEVGPRDGLQMERQVVPLEKKEAWILGLMAAGVDIVQVGSFVHPDRVVRQRLDERGVNSRKVAQTRRSTGIEHSLPGAQMCREPTLTATQLFGAEFLAIQPLDLHLHVPAGAVPKDGPSAGVTMVTPLSSLATGRPVRSDVGMTGEVTLNGRVLPIGGVKQKLLAAQRAGLKTVFVPKRNEPDLDDVPAEVLAELDVRPVADVGEILALALEPVGATGSVHPAVA